MITLTVVFYHICSTRANLIRNCFDFERLKSSWTDIINIPVCRTASLYFISSYLWNSHDHYHYFIFWAPFTTDLAKSNRLTCFHNHFSAMSKDDFVPCLHTQQHTMSKTTNSNHSILSYFYLIHGGSLTSMDSVDIN